MPRRDLLSGLVLALSLIAPRALAGASPEDAALADSLYAEGGKLMEAGRWAEACPKIEASWKLDPGIGSTLRLAYCWQKLGRTASASAMYRETEAMARRVGDKRADEAAKYATELEPLLSRLVLEVAPESQAGGVEIRRDGKVIDAAAWASGIPIDPGPHLVEAAAAGRVPWKTTITIEARPGVTRLHVPVLAEAPLADKGAEGGPSPWGTQRIAGVAVGSVGLVGLAVGGIFGGLTLGKSSSSKAHCNAAITICDATGVDQQHGARATAHAADAALALGAAALVTGVVVFLTAPSGGPAAAPRVASWVKIGPIFGASVTGASLQGAW